MDQADGAGHHAVTKMAVHQLFGPDEVGASGTIGGYSETQFFQKLDAAQQHQDRIWGPTTHPAWAHPHAQREHAMASPYTTGLDNLHTDRDYVVGELDKAHAAHLAGDSKGEMSHLGAAAHALEDSYSDAHAFRDPSVYAGNPEAKVESFNVFDPAGISTHGPIDAPVSYIGEGTHDARFDVVPIDKDGNPVLPDHQAGAKATAEMLKTYFDARDKDGHSAHAAHMETLDKFFQPSPDGVHVNKTVTEAWKHERDERLDIRHHLEDRFHHQEQPQPYDKHPEDAGLPGGVSQARPGPEHAAGGQPQNAEKPPADQPQNAEKPLAVKPPAGQPQNAHTPPADRPTAPSAKPEGGALPGGTGTAPPDRPTAPLDKPDGGSLPGGTGTGEGSTAFSFDSGKSPDVSSTAAWAFDSGKSPDVSSTAAWAFDSSSAAHVSSTAAWAFDSSSAAHVGDAAAVAFDSSSAAHDSDAAALALDSSSAAHDSDAAYGAFDSSSAAHDSDAAYGAFDSSSAAHDSDAAYGAGDFSGASSAGDSAGGASDFSSASSAGDSAGGAADFSSASSAGGSAGGAAVAGEGP